VTQLPELPIKLAHTSLDDYETCPKRFYHKHLARDVYDKKSGAQLGGSKAHGAIRKRLKLREPLPQEFAQYEEACAEVESMAGIRLIEEALAVDHHGRVIDYKSPAAALRGILDCVILDSPNAFILDWKTNKRPWEDARELKTHAVLLRARYPDLMSIKGAYFWLVPNKLGVVHDSVDLTHRTWTDLCATGESIARRIRNNDWPPDKNPLCRFCPCTTCPNWEPSP
jgi:PD-(D/E)XK nuclease superfamily